MENKDIIAFIIAVGAGSFSIAASIFNWDFFFESRKAKYVLKFFGRQGARIFYIVLGLVLYFFAYKMFVK